jgi:hypothetical protein
MPGSNLFSGPWLLAIGIWQTANANLAAFSKTSDQKPEASRQKRNVILFDKIDKFDIKSV